MRKLMYKVEISYNLEAVLEYAISVALGIFTAAMAVGLKLKGGNQLILVLGRFVLGLGVLAIVPSLIGVIRRQLVLARWLCQRTRVQLAGLLWLLLLLVALPVCVGQITILTVAADVVGLMVIAVTFYILANLVRWEGKHVDLIVFFLVVAGALKLVGVRAALMLMAM